MSDHEATVEWLRHDPFWMCRGERTQFVCPLRQECGWYLHSYLTGQAELVEFHNGVRVATRVVDPPSLWDMRKPPVQRCSPFIRKKSRLPRILGLNRYCARSPTPDPRHIGGRKREGRGDQPGDPTGVLDGYDPIERDSVGVDAEQASALVGRNGAEVVCGKVAGIGENYEQIRTFGMIALPAVP